MPLYLCRWFNGDCSIVLAPNREDAIERLDDVANPEGCPITELGAFEAHFGLTDEGELELQHFGAETQEEIFTSAYPVLDAALGVADDHDGGSLVNPVVAKAVEIERTRLRTNESSSPEPQTEMGREVKAQTGMPTILVDRIVDAVTAKRLADLGDKKDDEVPF